jgi:hypothetical protein
MVFTRVPLIEPRVIAMMALCVAALVAPTAHAAPCDTLPKPEVVLAPVFAAPMVDTSLDLAGLQALSRSGDSPHGEIGHLLGLTMVKMVGSFNDMAYDAVPVDMKPGAGFCPVIKKMHLRIGFEDIVIHIAHEVTGDRCLYDQVRQHEGRHVQVDRELLAQYGPRIAINMRAQVAALGVVHGASPDAVALEIQRRVEAALATEFNAFTQEMHRRQRFIDRPEEYQRMSQVCGGASSRLIAASRRSSPQ